MKINTVVTALTAIGLLSGTVFASPTLERNSQGKNVLLLQKKLYLMGYNITKLDGIFDLETEQAVIAFQHDKEIEASGIVRNITWRTMKNTKNKKGRLLSDLKGNYLPKISKSYETYEDNPNFNISCKEAFITKKQGQKIVSTARDFIGVPYVFGGTSPSGFDCSGLLQYVFKVNGLNIPRTADEQYNLGRSATKNQLKTGDLVFFSTYTEGVSHCGIYVGGGDFLHASSSKGVCISNLDNEYWKSHYIGAKNLVMN